MRSSIPIPLPIDSHLDSVLGLLENHESLIVRASPGSGKTTRIPPALLRANWIGKGKVLVLEPRRLAALFAARRVADEMGEQVGETVGYHFRFERKESAETRVLFLTEGMFLRRLLHDPDLKEVQAVVLDEFHERHLSTDIAIAYLRELQGRRKLKLIVASATLETEALQKYLNAPLIDVVAPRYPVEIVYLPQPAERSLDRCVADAVAKSLATSRGNTLVFLPGMGEIRRAETALGTLSRNQGFDVFVLHGDLTREEQDKALSQASRPKVILSTNIAESSLTIEGITAVIDSGLHRQASHSWWSGLPSLQTKPISRASATQRAGRAGRTGPGFCYRLYSQGDFEGRPLQDTPEIRRADLTQSILELKALGIADPLALPWLEPPNEGAVEAACKLLSLLGAVQSSDRGAPLTGLGRELARLPLHPRLARVALEGGMAGVSDEICKLLALLSEGELESLVATDTRHTRPSFGAERVRRQIAGALDSNQGNRPANVENALAQALLAGFPDRVAKKKKSKTSDREIELSLCGEGNAFATNADYLHMSELFVVIDADSMLGRGQTQEKVRVRSLVAIEEEWLLGLDNALLTERDTTGWDNSRNKVITTRDLLYGKLVLESRVLDTVQGDGGLEVLAREVFKIPLATLQTAPADVFLNTLSKLRGQESLVSLWTRWEFLSSQRPALGFPDWNTLRTHWLSTMKTMSSAQEMSQTDWASAALSLLTPQLVGALNRLVPESVLVGQRKVPIQYGPKPWIESRLQDFFGRKAGPAIVDGTVPLTLHLLAPNLRALQVTSDLTGFWEREYPRIRKELGRKYPRHSWPEDPLTAAPPAPRPPRGPRRK